MKKIKYRTEFSNDFNSFVTVAGNGKNEIQFELKDGKPVVKVDNKTGEFITYNRWADIQKNKDTNNYKKLLEAGGDIKMFAAPTEAYVDTTQFGDSGAELLSAQAKLHEAGISVEDLKSVLSNMLVNEIKKSQVKKEPEKKQEVNNVDKK